MPEVPEQSQAEEEISDEALDDLLETIQSEDPMDHSNEPHPGEEIDEESIPDPAKLKEESEQPKTEEEPKTEEPPAVGKELIQDIRSIIKIAKERFSEDRHEAQEIVDYIKDIVMHQEKPSAALVEALVAAMKVKTDATANITRIGDMASRALSSGRDHIDKKTSSDTDMEALYEALSTPEYGDEEDRRKRQQQNADEEGEVDEPRE